MKAEYLVALERFMVDQWMTPSDVVELIHLYAKEKGLNIDAILKAGKLYADREVTQ